MTGKVYLVGGAVRDLLMDKEPKDRDYVVTGSNVETMLENGYSQVGADFPVFLHPVTGDEYALARRERKTGEGYTGFETEFGSEITIADDLARRDLTINSMAVDSSDMWHDTLVDPFGGQQDIKDKVLRHTSEAFQEDPVRVLRVARFRARFGKDWKVAEETQELIFQMARKGTLNELQPERIWKEMSRALMEPNPRLFFDTLLEADVLNTIFPEIYRLKTALESRKWHPEGDAYEHTMLVLTQAALLSFDLDTRFACLVHDIGKGITPRDLLPKHYGHDVKGVPLVEDFGRRLSVPVKTIERAKFATRYHMYMHKLYSINAKTFEKMFGEVSREDPSKVSVLHEVGVCDERGRLGSERNKVDHLTYLFFLYNAYTSVKFADVFPEGETNVNKIRAGMSKSRINAMKKAKSIFNG